MKILFSYLLLAVFFSVGSVQARAPYAPESLIGMDVVLSILEVETALPEGYPSRGSVVQSYYADGTYSYRGAGGPHHLSGAGTYSYRKTGDRTAVEEAVQSSDFFVLPYVMEYTFERPDFGYWVQYFADGLIVFRGSFSVSPQTGGRELAPDTLAGEQIRLKGLQKNAALLHYAADTYFQCGKAGNSGTYRLHKMSSTSLVEEGVDARGGEYVRVYTFTGRRKGKWHQIDAINADSTPTHGTFQLMR